MPGGFNLSAVKSSLPKNWGFGPQRADGVLLLGTTVEPPNRLGSEAGAKAWLDGVVALYAQHSGITLSSNSSGGSDGRGGGGGVMSSGIPQISGRAVPVRRPADWTSFSLSWGLPRR